MSSLEWMVQRTSALWAAGLVMLTAMLTLWGAPPDVLAQATPLQNFSYGYDNRGNVTAITDTINGNQTFGYDELDRLTNATGPYGSQTYSYDQIGNMLSNPLVGTYSYPVSGASSVRPHAVSTAGSNTYSYDNDGNMTSGAGRTLTYDFENRPTSITSGGVTTTMVYDGDGGRVKKIAGDVTVRYIGKLYECDNATCVKYIFAGSQRIAVKQVTNGLVDYYHADHLGSSSVITHGTTGAVEENLAYYAYGATRTNTSGTTPPTDVPYKYTGQELDNSTGLYFYGARYYDATLGRFISADTIVPSGADPQAFNRYSYVRNNPLIYTDPTGHSFLGSFGRTVGRIFRDIARIELKAIDLYVRSTPLVALGLVTPQQFMQGFIIAANLVYPGAGLAIQASLLLLHAEAGDRVDPRAVGMLAADYVIDQGAGYVKGLGADPYLTAAAAGAGHAAVHGGNVTEGALISFGGAVIADFARAGYKSYVGYDIDIRPGGNAVVKWPDDPAAAEGANNIGFRAYGPEQLGSSCFAERGACSKFLNLIPGINAVAGFHDVWTTGLVEKGFSFSVINVPTMLPSLVISYAGAINPSTGNPLSVDILTEIRTKRSRTK